jgi:hypothetical protein
MTVSEKIKLRQKRIYVQPKRVSKSEVFLLTFPYPKSQEEFEHHRTNSEWVQQMMPKAVVINAVSKQTDSIRIERI